MQLQALFSEAVSGVAADAELQELVDSGDFVLPNAAAPSSAFRTALCAVLDVWSESVENLLARQGDGEGASPGNAASGTVVIGAVEESEDIPWAACVRQFRALREDMTETDAQLMLRCGNLCKGTNETERYKSSCHCANR